MKLFLGILILLSSALQATGVYQDELMDIARVEALWKAHNRGNDRAATVMHFVAYQGFIAALRKLVQKEKNLNVPTRSNKHFDLGSQLPNDRGGSTSLMLASYKGHVEIVDFLLSHGAQPNAQDDYGQTALHYAILQSFWPYKPLDHAHKKIIELLLQHGADVRIADEQGNDALYYYKFLAALVLTRSGYVEDDPDIALNDPLYQEMLDPI